jgi:hypothetical protein
MVMLGHYADDADANSAEPRGDLPPQRTMRHQLALMDPSMSTLGVRRANSIEAEFLKM